VTNGLDQTVSVIDVGVTGRPIPAVPVKPSPPSQDPYFMPVSPQGIAVSPEGSRAYVTVWGTDPQGPGLVAVIDTRTNTALPDSEGGQIAVGRHPEGLTVSPDGAYVYVANFDDSTVSVIDTASGRAIACLQVGKGPSSVAVRPPPGLPDAAPATISPPGMGTSDEYRGYVTNAIDGTVSVVSPNGKAFKVAATVPVGRYPVGAVVSPDGKRVYVANLGDDTLSVIDAGSYRVVSRIAGVRAPNGVVLSPTGRWLYVTSQFDRAVWVIDTTINRVVSGIPGVGNASGVTISRDGRFVSLTSSDDGSLWVIDTESVAHPGAQSVKRLNVGPPGNPAGVAACQNDSLVYVVDRGESVVQAGGAIASKGAVSLVDTSQSNPVLAVVNVGGNAAGVAVNPAGTRAYVSVQGIPASDPGFVAVIDTATSSLLRDRHGTPVRIPVGVGPTGVAVSPDGTRVYVTNSGDANLSVVDTGTNAELPYPAGMRPKVGNNPAGVVVSPNGKHVYVTGSDDLGNGIVAVVDTETNQTRPPVLPVGSGPQGIAVTSDGKWVYVANSQDATVSVLAVNDDKISVGACLKLGCMPEGLAVSGTKLLVTDPPANSVLIVDCNCISATGAAPACVDLPPTPTCMRTVTTGINRPHGVVASADGRYIYVGSSGQSTPAINKYDSTVAVIDTAFDPPEVTPILVGARVRELPSDLAVQAVSP
jgi:YVTN family beta-propeller protein